MAKLIYARKEWLEQAKIDLSIFPNFHISGSRSGMKRLYYGKDSFLVQSGYYVYKVDEETYNKCYQLRIINNSFYGNYGENMQQQS